MKDHVIPEWIKLAASAIISVITVGAMGLAYLFTHFESHEAAAKTEQSIMQRLDRIEDKIDGIRKDLRQ